MMLCGRRAAETQHAVPSTMRIITAILIGILWTQSACAKTAPSHLNAPSPQSTSTVSNQYPNAKAQANQLNDAILSGDYEKAADLTYPKLIQLIGGRAKYLALLKGGMNETQSDQFRIIFTVSDDPTDIIEVGSDVYAILPTTMKIKVAEGILVGQSSLIGVSHDRGKHWTFVDGGKGFSHEQLKTLFPAVANRLKIPERKRPVLQRAP
jgi:hypothetical protein